MADIRADLRNLLLIKILLLLLLLIIIIIIIIIIVVAKNGMESTGLKGNEKTCAVIHVKRGQVEEGSGDMKIADLKPIKSLDQHNAYKFQGVFENTKQEDKQVLEAVAKT